MRRVLCHTRWESCEIWICNLRSALNDLLENWPFVLDPCNFTGMSLEQEFLFTKDKCLQSSLLYKFMIVRYHFMYRLFTPSSILSSSYFCTNHWGQLCWEQSAVSLQWISQVSFIVSSTLRTFRIFWACSNIRIILKFLILKLWFSFIDT